MVRLLLNGVRYARTISGLNNDNIMSQSQFITNVSNVFKESRCSNADILFREKNAKMLIRMAKKFFKRKVQETD